MVAKHRSNECLRQQAEKAVQCRVEMRKKKDDTPLVTSSTLLLLFFFFLLFLFFPSPPQNRSSQRQAQALISLSSFPSQATSSKHNKQSRNIYISLPSLTRPSQPTLSCRMTSQIDVTLFTNTGATLTSQIDTPSRDTTIFTNLRFT